MKCLSQMPSFFISLHNLFSFMYYCYTNICGFNSFVVACIFKNDFSLCTKQSLKTWQLLLSPGGEKCSVFICFYWPFEHL